MSDPSADEKWLAELRADDGGITREDFLFMLRLLDAAQARQKYAEDCLQDYVNAIENYSQRQKAAEERASALVGIMKEVLEKLTPEELGPKLYSIAREALAQSEAPEDAHAAQTAESHEDGDKS